MRDDAAADGGPGVAAGRAVVDGAGPGGEGAVAGGAVAGGAVAGGGGLGDPAASTAGSAGVTQQTPDVVSRLEMAAATRPVPWMRT
jgi:hypothetical protein